MENEKQKQINSKTANDIVKWLRTLKSSVVTGLKPGDFAKVEVVKAGVRHA